MSESKHDYFAIKRQIGGGNKNQILISNIYVECHKGKKNNRKKLH